MLRFISLSLVATAAAQMDMKALIGDMSPQCQAAAGSLVTSDFSACSNLMGLVNVLGASGSLIAPLDTWVNSICSITPCSASTIATAAATVQAGCDADAKKGVATALEVTALVPNYAAVRNALCLEYKSNHTRCASSLLTNTEKLAGRPLTLVELSGFLTGGVSSLAPALAKAPKEFLCNDCTHGLAATLSANASMSMNSSMPSMPMNGMPMNGTAHNMTSMTSGLSAVCGPSFDDGKVPDSIAISSGSSSNSTYSSAGKTPANGGAPSSANSVAIPFFASFALVGTASVFVALL
ncbi:hypothetical protein PCANC_26497 [Puccinia coronata f. sp. avenae]|uniref:Uncharacterized protein n=1 Tax=Puccinia coronata f. sp. avenae TaxID=200324 RepID=A0A2N5TJG9_9BASI|nr:hypothetical protein PCANC_26497 [Puccinia coronata f. sp. avenae]